MSCAQGAGPDGQCLNDKDNVCKAGQAMSKAGTCAADSDGDGVADVDDDDPDNDGKKEASGGDSCEAPPSCSGDAIACMQVKIQWRIDCNTRKKANIAGGHCGSGGMPVCTGDGCKASEHQQLIQQWKAACTLEKLLAKDGSSGGDPGTGTVPVPDLSGVGDDALAEQVPEEADRKTEIFTDGSAHADGLPGEGGLDTSGFGWSRTCPSPPSVNLMGEVVTLNIGPFCDWMALGGWLVLTMAALLSLRILASAGT